VPLNEVPKLSAFVRSVSEHLFTIVFIRCIVSSLKYGEVIDPHSV
jgi:hypothetical protein